MYALQGIQENLSFFLQRLSNYLYIDILEFKILLHTVECLPVFYFKIYYDIYENCISFK